MRPAAIATTNGQGPHAVGVHDVIAAGQHRHRAWDDHDEEQAAQEGRQSITLSPFSASSQPCEEPRSDVGGTGDVGVERDQRSVNSIPLDVDSSEAGSSDRGIRDLVRRNILRRPSPTDDGTSAGRPGWGYRRVRRRVRRS